MISSICENGYLYLSVAPFIEWDIYRDAIFCVTSATGLIGKNLVNALAYISNYKELNIKIVCVVRVLARAKKYLGMSMKILFLLLGTLKI